MAAELRDYLLKDILYWRMQASATLPMLTLGGYLLRLHRLRGLETRLNGEQRAALDRYQAEYDAATGERPARTALKLQQETEARVKLAGQYVAELQQGGAAAGHWPHEAETRTMIALLLDALRALGSVGALAALEERVQLLDNQLERYLVPGPFAGQDEWQAAYPRDRFWWMYMQPARAQKVEDDED